MNHKDKSLTFLRKRFYHETFAVLGLIFHKHGMQSIKASQKLQGCYNVRL